jgi:signal transduction histidine kinase
MSHKFKSASRLTIIFILAVVLSGSVLAYFSINNISNLKELTEKKIIEEQRELSAAFSAALQNKLDTITAGLGNEDDKPELTLDALARRANEFDFRIHPFILNRNGNFAYPNFEGIHDRVQRTGLSERFISSFREGEAAEFAEKDLRKAENQYLYCLNYATGSSDSAKALNALGRVAVKLNNDDDVLTRYSAIALKYFHVCDENRYPYVYYALPQLLKISATYHDEKLVPLIEFSLEKMESGLIPLNYSTEELLVLIRRWIKESALPGSDKMIHINGLIENLDQKLQFVKIYGKELTELLGKNNWDTYYKTSNDFLTVSSTSGDGNDFFLIHRYTDYLAGFSVNRNKLLDTLLKADILKDFNFDYIIEFPIGYSANSSGDNLVFSSQLNPCFQDQMIWIRLKDKDLINDIVRRRAWIYGIASLMLLLAMVLGVALILRDIAREKRLARLRSDFISNVTHELKTPLTSIRMYAESLMLGRVKSATTRHDYLSVVVNESERLKRMINNILEFSKMEKSKQEYHPVETRLSDVLLKAISDLKYWLDEKGFELAAEIDRDITVEVDPEKLHQVYTNLLSNAIKYSGDSREIKIRLYRNANETVTEIEDAGIGIARENQERIFEEFYRVERQDSGEITGTGLGLTVAREIVEAHNGKIVVESEIGKGSKFTVRIPE